MTAGRQPKGWAPVVFSHVRGQAAYYSAAEHWPHRLHGPVEDAIWVAEKRGAVVIVRQKQQIGYVGDVADRCKSTFLCHALPQFIQ